MYGLGVRGGTDSIGKMQIVYRGKSRWRGGRERESVLGQNPSALGMEIKSVT